MLPGMATWWDRRLPTIVCRDFYRREKHNLPSIAIVIESPHFREELQKLTRPAVIPLQSQVPGNNSQIRVMGFNLGLGRRSRRALLRLLHTIAPLARWSEY